MTKKLEYDDEFEYQNLMTEEEFEPLKQAIERNEYKYLWVDKTNWFNFLTKKKGTVHNILIMALGDNSNRPIAINKIQYVSSTDGTVEKEWIINEHYAHINLNEDSHQFAIIKDEDGKPYYKLKYQSICCPITNHHFYTRDLKELATIFMGQFMGQNNNSAFQSICSVKNNYKDMAIYESGCFVKDNAPVLQLITKRPTYELRDVTIVRNYLAQISLPADDSQVMVKLREENTYQTVSKTLAEEYKRERKISNYYPIITYEQTQHILDSLPKIDVDFACIGLGSAGTGILDQVGRGSWFHEYLLMDMDVVEHKNLRNQWYNRDYQGNSKDYASRCLLNKITTVSDVNVRNIQSRFQEAHLENYTTKYVVSGFDSIECRLELLDMVESKKFEAKYLIDTRYDDLNSSIYFIDTTDEKQMKYYRKGLESDLAAFKEIEAKKKEESKVRNEEQFLQWLDENDCFYQSCSKIKNMLGENIGYGCTLNTEINFCGGEKCKEYWTEVWRKRKDDTQENFYLQAPQEENSCVKQNFIDIYKYSSAYVFAAIREIESGNSKPFTHIEATTDVLPKAITLRG